MLSLTLSTQVKSATSHSKLMLGFIERPTMSSTIVVMPLMKSMPKSIAYFKIFAVSIVKPLLP